MITYLFIKLFKGLNKESRHDLKQFNRLSLIVAFIIIALVLLVPMGILFILASCLEDASTTLTWVARGLGYGSAASFLLSMIILMCSIRLFKTKYDDTK